MIEWWVHKTSIKMIGSQSEKYLVQSKLGINQHMNRAECYKPIKNKSIYDDYGMIWIWIRHICK